MKRVLAGELQVGECLVWDLFDERNQLLLAKGTMIGSIRQIESLLLRGACRVVGATGGRMASHGRVEVEAAETPFDQLNVLVQRLATIFAGVDAAQGDSSLGDKAPRDPLLRDSSSRDTAPRCYRLVEWLERLLDSEPDAMLGAVHLVHEHPYTLMHPIRCASLAALLCETRGYSSDRRRSVILAALLQNVAMRQLQQELVGQSAQLSVAQQEAIERHPEQSAQMMAAAGITDALALTVVRQHHERVDGQGYPLRLAGNEIREEAAILQLADRYCAMIAGRSYREALMPGEGLRALYVGEERVGQERAGQEGVWQRELVPQLIQMVGIYPPGSFVTLGSGETGIVVRRGKRGTEPIVRAYVSPRGGPYPGVFTRDCSMPSFRIVRIARPDPAIPFDLSRIWGFRD